MPDVQRATRLLGAAEVLRDEVGRIWDPGVRAQYERAVAAARAQVDEATFEAVWADGRAMTLEQAVAYALEDAG